MSATQTAKLDGLLAWLEENSFWNSELIEVKSSKYGGLGVFWRLGPEDDPDQDRLLLRIPKSNILSPKNSFLYSLLVDHSESESEIDLSKGMHAIVLTFIYELSLGKKSPWYPYLASIAVEDTPLPLCLWDDEEKEAFFNTECDLLNMLDSTELVASYWENVKFARKIKSLVPVPDVFETEDGNSDKIPLFGKFVQAVISRAFDVDKYHGLSLVPGADLFNHLSPVELGEMVEVRENVHFECDDDENLCELCGEIGCPHLDSDSESEDDEEMEDAQTEEMAENDESGAEIDEESIAELLENENVAEESESSQSDEEDSQSEGERENENEDEIDNEKNYDEQKAITMEDIAELEQESDAETVQDEEEVSTLSLSEDEDDETRVNPSAGASELAAELGDGSKCCDIVLSYLPNEKFNFEVFNTYGNELSNAYLLQRYGFVSQGNPNASCLLTVQMCRDLKRLRKTPKGKTSIELKLQWYEEVGFPIVNELCSQTAQSAAHDHDHDPSHNHGDGCCENESMESEQQEKLPDSWELSARICSEGYPTEQTLALLRLMQMNFTVFFQKFYRAPSERKLEKRIQRQLLKEEISAGEKAVLKRWISERLQRYKPEISLPGPKGDMVRAIIREEKALLKRATQFLST